LAARSARLPRTGSAQGRVFCAFLPADEIPGLDEQLRDDPDLRRELARIRRDGICSYTGRVSGVRSIAAPVYRGEVLVAAMAVVGTIAWVPDGPGSAQAKALRRTAADVSADLSDQPPRAA
jgi:DNA-binding IclR family transcriptional regulator